MAKELNRAKIHEIAIQLMYSFLMLEETGNIINFEDCVSDACDLPYEECDLYLKEVLIKCLKHQEQISAFVSKYLKNWEFRRLNTVIQAIFIVSVAEFFFVEESLSSAIIINNAVKFSKKFGDGGEKDYKYVNAVLQNCLKMKTENFYSVSQINQSIKELFDNIPLFQNITIKGEVSNFHGRNKSGHLYFSLKDDKSSISVCLFKYQALGLTFEPKNGDLVYATGSLSCYTVNGTYQLICKSLTLEGEGDLLLKKMLLKKKLYAEGIFDASHKKELPIYPEKIVIITGKNSAAAKDFVFNINRRYPIVKIELVYSLVQGVDAPKDLVRALQDSINLKPDLIIIGRGGGSTDDLEAFDDENLVRAIYNCEIPVLSAIGHEINLSLCDLVADKHASTPTGAAELAVPDIEDVKDDILRIGSYLNSLMTQKITNYENRLLKLKSKKCFSDVSAIFEIYDQKIRHLNTRMDNAINQLINRYDNKINHLSKNLELISPTNLLDKGYSLLINQDGKVVTSINDVKIYDAVSIKLKDGTVHADVKEVLNDEPRN